MSLFLMCELLIVYFCSFFSSLFLILILSFRKKKDDKDIPFTLRNPDVQQGVLPSVAGSMLDALIYISIPSDCRLKV